MTGRQWLIAALLSVIARCKSLGDTQAIPRFGCGALHARDADEWDES
jgi:hypothetical protein